jgi:glycogen phosphorylase
MGQQSGKDVGWAIGSGETYQDPGYQDQVEAEALYNLLEREVVPTFYERRSDGLPRKWVERMKSSMTRLCPEFNMHRMVMQYADEYYLAAHRRHGVLHAENAARARNMAAWKKRVEAAWPRVQIKPVVPPASEVDLGKEVTIGVEVALDALAPEDVLVQLLAGRVDVHGALRHAQVIAMESDGRRDSGGYFFRGMWQPSSSGLCGYAIRVLAKHADAVNAFFPALIVWAGEMMIENGELVHG